MFAAAAPHLGARPFATPRTIVAMMLREMVTTYGRSPGGYLWAVLEPVAAIGLLSLVFSLAFRAPSLGGNFPLFYASAYLPYMLFIDINNKLAAAIRFSRPLLAYPAITLVDVILARFLLNLLTHIMVYVVVVAGIVLAFDLQISLKTSAVINAFGMSAVLALGAGTLNCYLTTAFPIYDRIWQIATRPLVIVSGLFFVLESVPPDYRDILWFNPLYHVTGAMRDGLYATYDATYVAPGFVYLIGLICLALGLLLLKKNYRDLINT